jgi:uncharacterized membrane protein
LSEEKSGGRGGCFLIPVAAITVVLGVILWAFFGWEAKDAAATGLQAGFGLVCGLPIALITFAAIVMVIGVAIGAMLNKKDRYY